MTIKRMAPGTLIPMRQRVATAATGGATSKLVIVPTKKPIEPPLIPKGVP